jgi:peptide deformylase
MDLKNPKLIYYPNPILRQKSKPVDRVTDTLQSFTRRLHALMVKHHGVGLSAIQVGVPLRIIVINTTGYSYGKKLSMINPEILEVSEDTEVMEEGCLSFPGQWVQRTRPVRIKVRYKENDADHTNRYNVTECRGITAQAILHEMEHLEGILLPDPVPSPYEVARALKGEDDEK